MEATSRTRRSEMRPLSSSVQTFALRIEHARCKARTGTCRDMLCGDETCESPTGRGNIEHPTSNIERPRWWLKESSEGADEVGMSKVNWRKEVNAHAIF